MSTTTPSAAVAPTVLTEDQRRAAWAAVAAGEAHGGRPAKPRPPRAPFDRADVQVRVVQPGGGVAIRTVYAHDLALTGMSLLHPGYLHVGSAVQVTLPRRLGGVEVVDGRVTACRYAAKVWHACEVAFDGPVSLRAVLRPGELDRLPGPGPAVRPDQLTGDVLVVDGQELDRMLLSHLVRKTKLRLTAVLSLDQAARALADVRFDVAVLDMDSRPAGVGLSQAVDGLRQAGHTGAVVATGADLAPWFDRLAATGVEHTIGKPYEESAVLMALAAAVASVGGFDADPLSSDLAGQDGMEPLLAGFCHRARQAADELRQHAAGGRSAAARVACVAMRGSAGGYGYPSLMAAAGEAVRAIDAAGGDVGEASAAVGQVVALCRRVSPRRPPPTSGR